MAILKKFIFALMILSIFSFFLPADLDPAYVKTFGYGSICVSKGGFPQKTKYDASQFEFRDGKFFVEAGGTIDLRSFNPKGKLYKDLLDVFTKKHKEYSKVIEDNIYWRIFANYDFAGNKLFDKWDTPEEMMTNDKEICLIAFSTKNGVRDWDGSAVKWGDTNNDLKRDVGMWLNNAKPGWQLYIVHSVGFQRNFPELQYWDYNQGKTVVPIGYEMAPPIGHVIVEVK